MICNSYEGFLFERDILKLRDNQMIILEFISEFCKVNNLEYFLIAGSLLGAIRHRGFIPWDDDIDLGMKRKDYDKFVKLLSKQLNLKFYLQHFTTEKNIHITFSKLRLNQTICIEERTSHLNIHQGISIDIFPLDFTFDNDFLVKIQWKLLRMFKKILSAKSNTSPNRIVNWIGKYLLPLSPKAIVIVHEFIAKLGSAHRYRLISSSGIYTLDKEIHRSNLFSESEAVSFEEQDARIPSGWDEYLVTMYGKYMVLPPFDKRISHHRIIKFKSLSSKENTGKLDLNYK